MGATRRRRNKEMEEEKQFAKDGYTGKDDSEGGAASNEYPEPKMAPIFWVALVILASITVWVLTLEGHGKPRDPTTHSQGL
eukprot:CAMPEP_0204271060 /NCGR_PEP_ID=MMETSP0468-20130131/19245_1 /ASSEMBLY_ACC=CAM_ASM_000383 /TAXON_ID=2969 /ORGANISM="Oxyrrhis marina" /LENGTH=80 /DNA_ID=CAMNT_0051246667 /DNA_START=41 /DNA_END=283 /DNA_ORIENTATION=-